MSFSSLGTHLPFPRAKHSWEFSGIFPKILQCPKNIVIKNINTIKRQNGNSLVQFCKTVNAFMLANIYLYQDISGMLLYSHILLFLFVCLVNWSFFFVLICFILVCAFLSLLFDTGNCTQALYIELHPRII